MMNKHIKRLLLIILGFLFVFGIVVGSKIFLHETKVLLTQNEILFDVEEIYLYSDDITVESNRYYKVTFQSNFSEEFELSYYIDDEEVAQFELLEFLNVDETRVEVEKHLLYNPKFKIGEPFNNDSFTGSMYINDLSLLEKLSFNEYKETKIFFDYLVDESETISYKFKLDNQEVTNAHELVYLPGEWFKLSNGSEFMITNYQEYGKPIKVLFGEGYLESTNETQILIDVKIKHNNALMIEHGRLILDGYAYGHMYTDNISTINGKDILWDLEMNGESEGILRFLVGLEFDLDDFDRMYLEIYFGDPEYCTEVIPLKVAH